MDFDHLEQVKALADAPMAPPATPKGSAWGAIKAAGRGVVAAGAEVFSQLESLHASGNWEENGDPNDPINVERRRSRQLSIEYAKRYGDYARSLRPDPATAGTAEQVLFGLSKGLTKAVTAVTTMGPAAGAVAFGGSEAASTYTDLRHEGVDSGTAGQAAAVSGVLNAAGVLLPMAGPTLKATAGLYLAGGPGGYMAQQALTREVLSRAGYDEIAKKYDPLDPVGLALSALIPLPFAAHGALRNVRAAKGGAAPDVAPLAEPAAATKAPEAAPHEAVDAAMVHNLTLLQDAHEATSPAKMAAEVARPVVTDPMPAAAIASTSGPIVPPGARQVQDILAASPDARDAMTQAMAAMESVRKSGGSVEQFLSSSGLPGPVQNLLVGLSEQGGAPQRVAALARALADQAAAKVDLLDATANAVERLRSLTDDQIKGVETALPAPSADPVLQQTAARVQELEATAGDMLMRVEPDGTRATLADDLAAVRKEAAEGTDAELGALDADLVRVAAECAMSLGA